MLKASSTGQQGYGAGDTLRQRAKDESLVPKADLPKPVRRTDLNSILGMKDIQDQSWINSRDVEPAWSHSQPQVPWHSPSRVFSMQASLSVFFHSHITTRVLPPPAAI